MRLFNILITLLFLTTTVSQASTFIKGPALIEGFTTITSAAGTTTLTAASETKQIITGTTTQTIVLPDATTIPLGRKFYVINKSTGTVTVNASGGGLVATVLGGQQKEYHLRVAGSAAGTWDATRLLTDVANDTVGVLPVANGGTNSATALTNNRVITSSGGSIVEAALITGSRLLVSDVNGIPTHTAVTTTEAGYLSGLGSSAVGISDIKILTNKDFDGGVASNTSRITVPKAAKTTLDGLTRKEATVVYASDVDKLYYDNGTILKVVGSGSGGVTNFIPEGDLESGDIFGIYNDSSGSRPADGTGGVTDTATSLETTAPLSGTTSVILSKFNLASQQGSGWSIPFTIDTANKAKVLQIEFDYMVRGGTFAAGSSTTDSDVIVYIYDVTNAKLIEPSSIKLLSNSTTIPDKFVANFQTSATGTSYRLIYHIATTTALAFDLFVDNIVVKPSDYMYGTPISNWFSFTSTISNLGAGGAAINQSKYRIVGDSIELLYTFQKDATAGSGTVDVTWSLPAGLNIDAAKLPSGSITSRADNIGSAWVYTGAFAANSYFPLINNATTLVINQPATAVAVKGADLGANVYIVFRATVPILGQSSSVQMSDGYDGRQIGFRANNSATAISGTPTKIVWTNTDKDDVAGYSSGTYTVRSAGWYDVGSSLYISGTPAVDGTATIDIYRNGSAIKSNVHRYKVASITTTSIYVGDSFYFNAGDTIEIYASTDMTTPSISSSTSRNVFNVNKRQAPTTMSATERISFSATSSSTAASATAPFVYPTVVENSHGAYSSTSGKFTAPIPGKYFFSASAYNGGAFAIVIYKNSTAVKQGQQATATSVSTVTHTVYLLAGETVEARPDAAVTANGSAILNTFDGFLIK